MAAAACI